MTKRINYTGSSGIRVIKRTDVTAVGLPDPGADLVWQRSNNHQMDVSDAIATFLLLADPDFHEEGGLLAGEIITANAAGGKVLAFADTQTTLTVANGVTSDVPLLTIGFDVTALKPVDVFFYIPWLQSGASGMTGAALIRDLASVNKGYIPLAMGATTFDGGRVVHERITVPGHYDRKATIQVLTGASGLNVNANLAYVRAHLRAVEG